MATTDDPRLKRVLKRYRKSEDRCDAALDVTRLGLGGLREALGCAEDDPLVAPHPIDAVAAQRLADGYGIPLDLGAFDFFLHTYVREECVSDYYADPTPWPLASPESGPPTKIPLPPGMRWVAVRPRDGREHYVGVPVADA